MYRNKSLFVWAGARPSTAFGAQAEPNTLLLEPGFHKRLIDSHYVKHVREPKNALVPRHHGAFKKKNLNQHFKIPKKSLKKRGRSQLRIL
jgi:hypothetical protein